jgi:hypothetical protein
MSLDSARKRSHAPPADHTTIINTRPAARVRRQIWLELPELDIGQPEEIANHRWSPFGDGESKNLFRKKLPLLAWNLVSTNSFHTQEGAQSNLPDSTTQRDGRRRSPLRPFQVFHAQLAAEIRSGKSDRLFPPEHELVLLASAQSGRCVYRESKSERIDDEVRPR